ncbi:MAG: hypothetical protein ACHP7H_00345 [Hyphomicrobiales bacterium]
MATHTDTTKLVQYSANSYPNIPGGEQRFITKELLSIQKSISQIIEVMKMLEARMNSNGLT